MKAGAVGEVSAARTPTIEEVAGALSYLDDTYVIEDGEVDSEMLAEGLAFERRDWNRADKQAAKGLFKQLSTEEWINIAERANQLSRDQGKAPRYTKRR